MTILNLKNAYEDIRPHLVNFANGSLFLKKLRGKVKILIVLLDRLNDEAPKVMAQTKASFIETDSDFV